MGSYKYTVSVPRARGIGGESDTTPPVESYDLGQKVRAALAAGAFKGLKLVLVLVAIVAIVLIVAALMDFLPPISWIVAVFVIIAVIGVARGLWEACNRGYDWSVKAASRPWEVDDEARQRRYAQEDAALKAQEEAIKSARERIAEGDDTDGNPLTFTDEQRLDWIALRMLELVYVRGQPGAATRDAMTGAGFCSQPEWNLVNKGMKALGLRKKQTWQDCTLDQAVASWRDNIRIEATPEGERYLQVLRQNGEWYGLERIE
jgi:hypothetical protein